MSKYWLENYWFDDYWPEDYWLDPDIVPGGWWLDNYWFDNYWPNNYWFGEEAGEVIISQTSTPSMTMAPLLPAIDITAAIFPGTASMTMTGLPTSASNDVVVTPPVVPNMSMTGINITADPGESYEGDINFVVFPASLFSVTIGIPVTLATMSMTGNNANVAVGADVVVGVTSTPNMSMTPFPAEASNPVTIQPGTPGMSMTGFNVQAGFGTVINAGVASMSMASLQTNVTGVSANPANVDVTLGTMSMSPLAATVQATSINEGVYNAAEYFPTGSAVTISLYDPVTFGAVALDSDVCVELGASGIFVWAAEDLSTFPTDYQEYLWQMTDGTTIKSGVIRVNAVGVNEFFTRVMENGETFEEQFRLVRANAAGTIVQQADGSYAIRDAADSKDRIVGKEGQFAGRDITTVDGS